MTYAFQRLTIDTWKVTNLVTRQSELLVMFIEREKGKESV